MDSQYIDSLMLNVGKTSIAALRNRLHYMGAIT